MFENQKLTFLKVKTPLKSHEKEKAKTGRREHVDVIEFPLKASSKKPSCRRRDKMGEDTNRMSFLSCALIHSPSVLCVDNVALFLAT